LLVEREQSAKGARPVRRFALVLLGLLSAAVVAESLKADDWPQWLGPQRDGVWRETGILKQFPAAGPKIVWRTPLGAGYAGPAVAGGKVYVMDRVLPTGTTNPADPFDKDQAIPGSERVVCLNEKTGKILWKRAYDCPYQISYPSGPRTTPVVDGGKVYTLGAMGDLLCLDVVDGKVAWSKNLPKDYQAPVPMWGYAAHLLVDGDRLITLAGGNGSVVVALDKNTGKELWRALSAPEIGYAPPIIVKTGGKRQLIVWHTKAVNSLNPETGAVYWSQRFPERGQVKAGMSIPTPRFANGQLLVSAFYNGALMLKLDPEQPTAEVQWRIGGRSEKPEDTRGLHAVMATPVLKDSYIYGVGSYGELRCLKADTGERVWMTRQPTTGGAPVRWANAFLVEQDGRYFLFNELGDLIIARLSPKGYQEVSRAHILEPTNKMAAFGGSRLVVWSHPAFADRCMFARNDREMVCVDLAAPEK
jgi:outer membrane protein assembly factor BamB